MKSKAQLYVLIAAIPLFFSCASYYLEDFHAKLLNPNSSPVPVIEREKGDLRLNAGLVGSINSHEKSFNQDPFWDREMDILGEYESNPYSPINVHCRPVDMQGFLSVDETFSKRLFAYFNGNLAKTDGSYCGSGTLGFGYHTFLTTSSYLISNIGCQGFCFLGIGKINSQQTILSVLSDDFKIYSESNSITCDIGAGFQCVRQSHRTYLPNVGIGVVFQGVNLYFKNPFHIIPALLPTISLIQNINDQNQCDLSASYFLSRNKINWPYLQFAWSYCVKNKKTRIVPNPVEK